jgi:hypothetical protein
LVLIEKNHPSLLGCPISLPVVAAATGDDDVAHRVVASGHDVIELPAAWAATVGPVHTLTAIAAAVLIARANRDDEVRVAVEGLPFSVPLPLLLDLLGRGVVVPVVVDLIAALDGFPEADGGECAGDLLRRRVGVELGDDARGEEAVGQVARGVAEALDIHGDGAADAEAAEGARGLFDLAMLRKGVVEFDPHSVVAPLV